MLDVIASVDDHHPGVIPQHPLLAEPRLFDYYKKTQFSHALHHPLVHDILNERLAATDEDPGGVDAAADVEPAWWIGDKEWVQRAYDTLKCAGANLPQPIKMESLSTFGLSASTANSAATSTNAIPTVALAADDGEVPMDRPERKAPARRRKSIQVLLEKASSMKDLKALMRKAFTGSGPTPDPAATATSNSNPKAISA